MNILFYHQIILITEKTQNVQNVYCGDKITSIHFCPGKLSKFVMNTVPSDTLICYQSVAIGLGIVLSHIYYNLFLRLNNIRWAAGQ